MQEVLGPFTVYVDRERPLFSLMEEGRYEGHPDQNGEVCRFFYNRVGRVWKGTKDLFLVTAPRNGLRTPRLKRALTMAGWNWKDQGVVELLALGALFPELQIERRLWALGSVHWTTSRRFVKSPLLWGREQRRVSAAPIPIAKAWNLEDFVLVQK